jgi:dihydroorotate dehydrogenase electron transfer subunit
VTRPLQVDAEVVRLEPVGAYLALTLHAPGVPEQVLPGHFLAVQVGGPSSSMLLRRAFALYDADVEKGTVDVVFAVHGKGTAWLAERRAGELLDVVGPLGAPFALPEEPPPAVLVGGGYGIAPLLPLAVALRERGCRVDAVLGAASGDRLFGVEQARELCDGVVVTTDDGSAGERGRVSDPLPALLAGAGTAYACGPMGMLRAVADAAAAAGVACQVAVEESMACGIGVCMTCVLPVVGDDGRTRMVRSCVEGPVFGGDRVRWDAVGTVPADAVGSITAGGH